MARLQRHLEDYDAALVESLVSRQFPGHCHSMPSRGLHEIEFFFDLIISKAVRGPFKDRAKTPGSRTA
jgi:hypothetical protein